MDIDQFIKEQLELIDKNGINISIKDIFIDNKFLNESYTIRKIRDISDNIDKEIYDDSRPYRNILKFIDRHVNEGTNIIKLYDDYENLGDVEKEWIAKNVESTRDLMTYGQELSLKEPNSKEYYQYIRIFKEHLDGYILKFLSKLKGTRDAVLKLIKDNTSVKMSGSFIERLILTKAITLSINNEIITLKVNPYFKNSLSRQYKQANTKELERPLLESIKKLTLQLAIVMEMTKTYLDRNEGKETLQKAFMKISKGIERAYPERFSLFLEAFEYQ